jgi:hypothetical protein
VQCGAYRLFLFAAITHSPQRLAAAPALSGSSADSRLFVWCDHSSACRSSVPLTEIIGVKLYAERNPLFATTAARSPWIYALRFEQTMRAPMVRRPGTTGMCTAT